jgi:hypothetical protein
MGSWLSAAGAELVQGAVRPGCTQLILDIYVSHPNADYMDADGAGEVLSTVPSVYHYTSPTPPQGPPPPPAGEAAAREPSRGATDPDLKASNSPTGGKGRVLNRLQPSESELASLEAVAAAAGAEALQPYSESMFRSGAAYATRQGSPYDGGAAAAGAAKANNSRLTPATHLSTYVMHHGNVHAAAGALRRLLGPRAVQSMSVSINNEVRGASRRGARAVARAAVDDLRELCLFCSGLPA